MVPADPPQSATFAGGVAKKTIKKGPALDGCKRIAPVFAAMAEADPSVTFIMVYL